MPLKKATLLQSHRLSEEAHTKPQKPLWGQLKSSHGLLPWFGPFSAHVALVTSLTLAISRPALLVASKAVGSGNVPRELDHP